MEDTVELREQLEALELAFGAVLLALVELDQERRALPEQVRLLEASRDEGDKVAAAALRYFEGAGLA